MNDELLTPQQVAERLDCKVSTVRRWANDGRIVAVRLPNGRFRVRASVVEAILAGPAGVNANTAA